MPIKYRVLLYIGVFLFVASPFLVFITPDPLYKDILCDPNDSTMFRCTGKVYLASTIVAGITFILGSGLMLLAFYARPRKK